ncbi:MAG: 2-hydroxyacid dehydrogenase [Bdellovibrionales bacterium]|nr:2-hydroxyacid dehydrogenase [Bdellovibrionales bacterium]
MKIAFYDTHKFERPIFDHVNKHHQFEIEYIESRLTSSTAVLASECEVVCSFVNDKIDESCLEQLKEQGVRLIVLRSAGFNHVDISAANRLGIQVGRVPGYSPNAVAEYTVGLILCLNRKIHKSYHRVRELNFTLDGLVGFDLKGKVVGVIGTGKIGKLVAEILAAFGCEILCFDQFPNTELEKHSRIRYAEFNEICAHADIVSLHIPLTPDTYHLLNKDYFSRMKPGAYIINTGRGALIDSAALSDALKNGHVGGAALDVYEEEEAVFFQDVSDQVLQDDVLARLLTFPNVLISSHQAFLTKEALENIAETTLSNVDEFVKTGQVPVERRVSSV